MEGDLQVVVGANLRRLRKESGKSQEDWAAHMGWHRTWVGSVERGERNLTLKTLERMCQQLGLTTFDLTWDRSKVAVTLQDGQVLGFGPTIGRLPDGEDGDEAGPPELGPGGR